MSYIHFLLKNIFYDKMDLRLFYFHVTSLIRWIIGSLINIHQTKTEKCFTWYYLFLKLVTVFILLPLLNKMGSEKDTFFQCTCYFNISYSFLWILLHKGSYTLSWIYYNLYQICYILIRHNLACSGTLYMKVDLFKITKYFTHLFVYHRYM